MWKKWNASMGLCIYHHCQQQQQQQRQRHPNHHHHHFTIKTTTNIICFFWCKKIVVFVYTDVLCVYSFFSFFFASNIIQINRKCQHKSSWMIFVVVVLFILCPYIPFVDEWEWENDIKLLGEKLSKTNV